MKIRNLFYRVVIVIMLVAVLLPQGAGSPARSAQAQGPIYLPIVMKAPAPVTVTPPQETDGNGTVVFHLPQGDLQVTYQDSAGQPVQGMRAVVLTDGAKALIIAEHIDNLYYPTFREIDLSSQASSVESAAYVPVIEIVHVVMSGMAFLELTAAPPHLIERGLFYEERCWHVDQIANALEAAGIITVAGGPVLSAVAIGVSLVMEGLLTDLWCANDWDHPMAIRVYNIPGLNLGWFKFRGACGIPEDICSGRETRPLSGVVSDARTGSGIEGAYVLVEPSGPAAGTDSSGGYTMTGVPLGYHTVTASKDGYVSQSQLVNIDSSPGTKFASFSLSPVGVGDEYRFVLTWGADPRDLDSHLWLPSAHPYHIYYSNKGRLDAFPYAALDHDDTTSYGPETITMIRSYDSTYTYAVYHYAGTGSLTTSGAQVEIYRGDNLIRQVQVPTPGSGRWWVVATVDGTTGYVVVHNYITDTSPAPYVRSLEPAGSK